MTISIHAFQPKPASTVGILASNASANIQVQSGQTSRHMRVANESTTTWAYVEFGESGVTASAPGNPTAGSMGIPPGGVEIFSGPHQYMAAITASGTAQLRVTPGEGI
jgi:hypothetical protein